MIPLKPTIHGPECNDFWLAILHLKFSKKFAKCWFFGKFCVSIKWKISYKDILSAHFLSDFVR